MDSEKPGRSRASTDASNVTPRMPQAEDMAALVATIRDQSNRRAVAALRSEPLLGGHRDPIFGLLDRAAPLCELPCWD